jgi:hypothetical protein
MALGGLSCTRNEKLSVGVLCALLESMYPSETVAQCVTLSIATGLSEIVIPGALKVKRRWKGGCLESIGREVSFGVNGPEGLTCGVRINQSRYYVYRAGLKRHAVWFDPASEFVMDLSESDVKKELRLMRNGVVVHTIVYDAESHGGSVDGQTAQLFSFPKYGFPEHFVFEKGMFDCKSGKVLSLVAIKQVIDYGFDGCGHLLCFAGGVSVVADGPYAAKVLEQQGSVVWKEGEHENFCDCTLFCNWEKIKATKWTLLSGF